MGQYKVLQGMRITDPTWADFVRDVLERYIEV